MPVLVTNSSSLLGLAVQLDVGCWREWHRRRKPVSFFLGVNAGQAALFPELATGSAVDPEFLSAAAQLDGRLKVSFTPSSL